MDTARTDDCDKKRLPVSADRWADSSRPNSPLSHMRALCSMHNDFLFLAGCTVYAAVVVVVVAGVGMFYCHRFAPCDFTLLLSKFISPKSAASRTRFMFPVVWQRPTQ